MVKLLCAGAPEALLAIGGRFSAPVFPGELLRIELWRDGGGRASFRVRVPARDVIVMSHGFAQVAP